MEDLLKGDIVRPMATAVAKKWNLLRSQIERAAEVIVDRDLLANYSSFNAIIVAVTISKSASSMWSFLQQVHQFKEGKTNRFNWETALSLPSIMTAPDGISLADLKDAIQTRDGLVRRDLRDFIAGTKHRVDKA